MDQGLAHEAIQCEVLAPTGSKLPAEALERIDCEPRLPAIRCPALLMGEKDPLARRDLVGQWQAS